MQEEIINFSQMVTNYYKEFGKDNMVFDFLHINIKYTYVDLNSRIIDLNNNGIPVYNNGKRNRNELIFIPVVLEKEIYEKLFSDDDDYAKRTFHVSNNIDVGTSYHFNYAEVYKQINKTIPKDCHIVNDSEIQAIAKINGYENIYWDIQDENADMLPDYHMEPNWVTKVYGFKKLEEEKINTK